MMLTLEAVTDGETRARWITTLVDLAALILSMFVLLLATRSPVVPQAPTVDSPPTAVGRSPILEPSEPAATARVGLTLAWLRERLRDAALDGQVSVHAARDGVILDFMGAIAQSLAEPTGTDPDRSVRSLAALLRGLEPDVLSATLTYAGRGGDHVEDDLRRAGLSAAYLAQAGLRPRPEPVLTPTPTPGRSPLELRLIFERP